MSKKVMWAFATLCFLTAYPLALIAEAPSDTAEVDRIVRKLDDLYRSQSSYGEVEMEIITPHWQRTLAMKVWTLGLEKTFIRITSPLKEKGVATLRIGNEMWNYLPKVNKVIKIPPSMMMSSWMGSDFTNDDLVKEYSFFEDYTYRLITPEDAKEDLLYLECSPKEGLPIVWGSIIIAVRRADTIPVWQKYYDEKGNLMRIWNFGEVRLFSNRRVPAVMEIIPQAKEGNKTVVRYLTATFDADIEDNVFTLRNLRSR
ncbi:MAG: outer membrane lipoprotein-sorting protein [Candidatus Latescibacteria bacterium]|nr:outer membrane lipoprotein-sorting protein [Candidatus Latescibacterota bacterium]NIO00993.1 outer membrane lipoprotein-sorting protein [Candidatus Latescibacterota bacterium]NIO27392.1 outer membrane lipoprotein-sorting protein [Candidatus Latescibacterota bacterium]NIO54914.1 outer membrane lipoprotein-sorting protein [Candidatus Latescibacterota bacterium]NIT01003.1 outer membrane lipoprotein-sorting protein [Candidatus Latescibacterota bacterium]